MCRGLRHIHMFGLKDTMSTVPGLGTGVPDAYLRFQSVLFPFKMLEAFLRAFHKLQDLRLDLLRQVLFIFLHCRLVHEEINLIHGKHS